MLGALRAGVQELREIVMGEGGAWCGDSAWNAHRGLGDDLQVAVFSGDALLLGDAVGDMEARVLSAVVVSRRRPLTLAADPILRPGMSSMCWAS